MVSETTPPDPRKEIIEYLHAHPSAADTVDGIIGWWLPVQRYETAREVVEKTFDELVAEGLIDCIQTGNGRKIFLGGVKVTRGGSELLQFTAIDAMLLQEFTQCSALFTREPSRLADIATGLGHQLA